MITALLATVFISYLALNQYYILKRDSKAEWMIQLLSFASAAFFLLFGGWLYFLEPPLMWDGFILINLGFLLFLGHLNSAKHGYKGW